eukprot:Selendium_serpulae@DN2715_c0_g1_i1.p1
MQVRQMRVVPVVCFGELGLNRIDHRAPQEARVADETVEPFCVGRAVVRRILHVADLHATVSVEAQIFASFFRQDVIHRRLLRVGYCAALEFDHRGQHVVLLQIFYGRRKYAPGFLFEIFDVIVQKFRFCLFEVRPGDVDAVVLPHASADLLENVPPRSHGQMRFDIKPFCVWFCPELQKRRRRLQRFTRHSDGQLAGARFVPVQRFGRTDRRRGHGRGHKQCFGPHFTSSVCCDCLCLSDLCLYFVRFLSQLCATPAMQNHL